jgi:hypothetical protein
MRLISPALVRDNSPSARIRLKVEPALLLYLACSYSRICPSSCWLICGRHKMKINPNPN